MEAELDEIEKGKAAWRDVWPSSTAISAGDEAPQQAKDGVKLKVPDVLSDEYCEVCGRQMVVKKGKFGYFLACPGFPECTFTKPIVIEMPGKCPKCGGKIPSAPRKRAMCSTPASAAPSADLSHGTCRRRTSARPAARRFSSAPKPRRVKPFCINEVCPNFVPEDERGYKRKRRREERGRACRRSGGRGKKPAAKKAAAKSPRPKRQRQKDNGEENRRKSKG